MSDPGNIMVRTSSYPVYFYTHHEARSLPLIVAKALARGKTRWDDPQYLARILFCELVIEGEEVKGTTGFGIDTEPGEGGVTIYVDPYTQNVRFKDETYSFEAWCYRMLAVEV